MKIEIPQPCSENWHNMTPDANGRFCGHCQKTVIDFTSYTDQQLKDYLQKNSSSVCGYLQQSQISTSTLKPVTAYSGLKLFLSSLLLSLGLVNNAKGETNLAEVKLTSYTTQEISVRVSDSVKVITGRIISKEDNETVPGAVIAIKGTEIKTYSDKDGNFRLEIPAHLIPKKKITLTVNFIGYEETTKKIKSGELNKPLFLELKLDFAVLGGIALNTEY